MTDSTLNCFLARGTTTQRNAFTPSPPTPASGPSPGYAWWDTTLQALYMWDAGSSSWKVAITSASTALVKISETVTSSSQASVTFSSIPATYRDLIVVVSGRGTTSATTIGIAITVNGDSGANYDFQQIVGANGATSAAALVAQTAALVGDIPAATATANVGGSVTISVNNYAGTTFQKTLDASYGVKFGTSTSGVQIIQRSTWWRNTAAINALVVAVGAGGFVDGSVVTLYGRG